MKRERDFGTLFDLWAAPLLLLGIAVNQIRLARTADLTPWKGGGFGMFGSIDDPGARTIRCEAVDTRGQPVLIDLRSGGEVTQLLRKLKCYPNRRDLELLGGLLVESQYIRTEVPQKALLEKFRKENPGVSLQLPEIEVQKPVYRMRKASDPKVGKEHTTRLGQVTLQMFRVRWDDEKARSWCDPIGEPTSVKASRKPADEEEGR